MTREGEGRLTLALFLVAGTCVYAFSRVFAGRAWLVPTLAAAWGAIALTRWLAHLRVGRRLGGPGGPLDQGLAALVLAVVGGAFILVVVFPGATVDGLPTFHAIHTAISAMQVARRQISVVTAPIQPNPGYLAMAMAGAWVAGAISATLVGAPNRQRAGGGGMSSLSSSLMGPLPWVVLFTIAAGVGQGGGRYVVVGLFFAALIAYLLAEGWTSLEKLPKLDGVVRLGVLSLAGALILPNIVPGYRAGPVFPWARLGPTTETTISPLVQIKPRLLNQANVTLFQVQASSPAYWRLTSLDNFDGDTWSSQGTYNPASGLLSTPDGAISNTSIQQRYAITSLGGIWVPAAYVPTRVSGITASLDPSSATLIVSGLHAGNTYSVDSTEPDPTGAQLNAAGAGVPPTAQDLALPAATTAQIGPIARQITAGTAGSYEQAVALQDYLRGPLFTYSTNVPADSSTNYLYQFLTQTRTGYCEQFAGAMAVMLRILGIPSRVAVGFLPGQAVSTSGSLTDYTVTGKDAHAWPEAYFAGIGWVAFEPTPRTDVTPPAYTIPPGPAPATATQPGPTPEDTSLPSPAGTSAPRPAPKISAPAHQQAHHPVSAARRASDDLIIALLAAVILLLAAREARLRMPGWLARSPHDKAIAIYQEFLLRAADATGAKAPGDTEAEYARALVHKLSLPASAVNAVTEAYQQATYARMGPGDATLESARQANRALRILLWKRADWPGRIRLTLSLRPLFTRAPRPHPSGGGPGGSGGSRGDPYEMRPPRSSSAPSAARRV